MASAEVWLWAWPAIGFLTGAWLVCDNRGGGRRDMRPDGAVTDIGWLTVTTALGPLPLLLLVVLYACLFLGWCRE